MLITCESSPMTRDPGAERHRRGEQRQRHREQRAEHEEQHDRRGEETEAEAARVVVLVALLGDLALDLELQAVAARPR